MRPEKCRHVKRLRVARNAPDLAHARIRGESLRERRSVRRRIERQNGGGAFLPRREAIQVLRDQREQSGDVEGKGDQAYRERRLPRAAAGDGPCLAENVTGLEDHRNHQTGIGKRETTKKPEPLERLRFTFTVFRFPLFHPNGRNGASRITPAGFSVLGALSRT